MYIQCPSQSWIHITNFYRLSKLNFLLCELSLLVKSRFLKHMVPNHVAYVKNCKNGYYNVSLVFKKITFKTNIETITFRFFQFVHYYTLLTKTTRD